MAGVLLDKARKPTDRQLSDTLGRTRRHWDAILEDARRACEGLIVEWKHYGASYGWLLKLSCKRRALLHLSPMQGRFLAAMGLKGKALERALDLELPSDVRKATEEAKDWPEGRPIRIVVTNLKHVALVKKLVGIKADVR